MAEQMAVETKNNAGRQSRRSTRKAVEPERSSGPAHAPEPGAGETGLKAEPGKTRADERKRNSREMCKDLRAQFREAVAENFDKIIHSLSEGIARGNVSNAKLLFDYSMKLASDSDEKDESGSRELISLAELLTPQLDWDSLTPAERAECLGVPLDPGIDAGCGGPHRRGAD